MEKNYDEPFTVKLSLRDEQSVEVQGYPTADPGLVVTPAYPGSDEWGITHLRTGLSVNRQWWYESPQLAIEAANRLTQVIDSKTLDEVHKGLRTLSVDERLVIDAALAPWGYNCECYELPCKCPDEVLDRWPIPGIPVAAEVDR